MPNDPFTLARDKAPVVLSPGTSYHYSNPGMAMMSYVITAAIQKTPWKDVWTLLRERVMRPIGVPDDEWSVGYGQTFAVDGLPLVATWGGSECSARAVARVGRLLLRGGNWEGEQVLAEDPVRQVTNNVGMHGIGGIGWYSANKGPWLKPAGSKDDPPPGIGWRSTPAGPWEKLPKDAFWGLGAGHNVMIVVPSLRLIVIRNGEDMIGWINTPGSTVDMSERWGHMVYDVVFSPLMDAVAQR